MIPNKIHHDWKHITIFTFFLGYLITILGGIMTFFMYTFIDSFNFYRIGVTDSLRDIVDEIRDMQDRFPAKFFGNSKFRFLFMFIGIYFVAILSVPTFFGRISPFYDINFIFLVGLLLIFFIGTMINWHYGLKKYEAYN
jgi:hypothetical protein